MNSTFPIKISKEISNYTNLATALVLTASLSGYFILQRIPLYLFFISYIIDLIIDKRWTVPKIGRERYLFISFIFYFSLIPIYNLNEESNRFFIKNIETYLPFLVFGLIGFLGFNSKYKLKYFAYTLIIVSIGSVILIIKHIGIQTFINSPEKTELFAISRIELLNSHMNYNIYLNLSVLSIFYFYITRPFKYIYISTTILTICLIIVSYALLISDGRTGFITTLLLGSIFPIYFLIKWKKWTLIPFAIILIPAILYVVNNNKRLSKNFMEREPRIVIWKAGINTIEDTFPIGLGVSDGREQFFKNGITCVNNCPEDEFINRGLSTIKDDFIKGKMHTHNQFIWSTVAFGIIGILSLLFILIYPCLIGDKGKKVFIFLAVAIFAIQMIFENFGVGISVILFCFTLTLFFHSNRKLEER